MISLVLLILPVDVIFNVLIEIIYLIIMDVQHVHVQQLARKSNAEQIVERLVMS
jgi:hypothetical protein